MSGSWLARSAISARAIASVGGYPVRQPAVTGQKFREFHIHGCGETDGGNALVSLGANSIEGVHPWKSSSFHAQSRVFSCQGR